MSLIDPVYDEVPSSKSMKLILSAATADLNEFCGNQRTHRWRLEKAYKARMPIITDHQYYFFNIDGGQKGHPEIHSAYLSVSEDMQVIVDCSFNQNLNPNKLDQVRNYKMEKNFEKIWIKRPVTSEDIQMVEKVTPEINKKKRFTSMNKFRIQSTMAKSFGPYQSTEKIWIHLISTQGNQNYVALMQSFGYRMDQGIFLNMWLQDHYTSKPSNQQSVQLNGWQSIKTSDICNYILNSTQDFNKEAHKKKENTWNVTGAWKFIRESRWMGGIDYFAYITSGNEKFSTKFNIRENSLKIKFVTPGYIQPTLKAPKTIENLSQYKPDFWQTIHVKEIDSDIQKLIKRINIQTGEVQNNTYKPLKAWILVSKNNEYATKCAWLVSDDGSEYTVTYNIPTISKTDYVISNIEEGKVTPKEVYQ